MPDERQVHEQRGSPQTDARAPAQNGAPADGAADREGSPEDELARAQAQAADFEDRWKRSAAEFINYKRRTEQERQESARSAGAQLIRELLPILDDLERTLANTPPAEADSKWVEGVQLVERKFRSLLERQGLTTIESLGQPFDPAVHEAVGGSGSHVTEEYRRGYRLHGRTLRPATVVVGTPPAEAKERRPGDMQA